MPPTTTGEQSPAPSTPTQLDVVELSLTVHDQFYYVSREGGDTFDTSPFIAHTALYYALGLLPSQFRSTRDTAHYLEDYNRAAIGADVYVHPATAFDPSFTTRRFSCHGDAFRRAYGQENKNLKETGFQTFIDPGTRFRTFILLGADADYTADELAQEIPPHIRTGKKMTSTRVHTHTHRVPVNHGTFTLGHPIATQDIAMSKYASLTDIRACSLRHLRLFTAFTTTGDYVTVEPAVTPTDTATQTVALPVHTSFLGHQTTPSHQ